MLSTYVVLGEIMNSTANAGRPTPLEEEEEEVETVIMQDSGGCRRKGKEA